MEENIDAYTFHVMQARKNLFWGLPDKKSLSARPGMTKIPQYTGVNLG
jgi:hypothetical protein